MKRILVLNRNGVTDALDAERMVAWYAEKGITIQWGLPVSKYTGGRHTAVAAAPSRHCPGCKRDVKLHPVTWRRAVGRDGRAGRFMARCRRCEANAAKLRCRECHQKRRRDQYATTPTGNRVFTCDLCRAKPDADRSRRCTLCDRRQALTQFRDTTSGHRDSHCRSCRKAVARTRQKPRTPTTKHCRSCATQKPLEAFQTGQKGRRLWDCTDCRNTVQCRAQKACTTCRQTKPVGEFPKLPSNVDGRRDQCKPCHSRYTMRKRQRSRARKLEAQKRCPASPQRGQ